MRSAVVTIIHNGESAIFSSFNIEFSSKEDLLAKIDEDLPEGNVTIEVSCESLTNEEMDFLEDEGIIFI